MKFSEQSKASVIACIKEAVSRYINDEMDEMVTDIHMQSKQDTGELVVYNDEDEELARTIVEDWVDYPGEDFEIESERILKHVLKGLNSEKYFDQLKIMKPYSFVLVDDDYETLSELLLIDDEETMLIDEGLMKGLDEDLNQFLADLLK